MTRTERRIRKQTNRELIIAIIITAILSVLATLFIQKLATPAVKSYTFTAGDAEKYEILYNPETQETTFEIKGE